MMKVVRVAEEYPDPVVDLQHAAVGRVMRRAAAVAAHGARGLGPEEIDPLGDSHPNDRERVVIAEAPHLRKQGTRAWRLSLGSR